MAWPLPPPPFPFFPKPQKSQKKKQREWERRGYTHTAAASSIGPHLSLSPSHDEKRTGKCSDVDCMPAKNTASASSSRPPPPQSNVGHTHTILPRPRGAKNRKQHAALSPADIGNGAVVGAHTLNSSTIRPRWEELLEATWQEVLRLTRQRPFTIIISLFGFDPLSESWKILETHPRPLGLSIKVVSISVPSCAIGAW